MTVVEAKTNEKEQSCVDAVCDCNTMWSIVQQMATARLSDQTGSFKGRLIKSYAVRARRIAGTYARFYLEMESGGRPDKKGRFYWMALGAFASKTVACTLEAWQVRAQAFWISEKTKNGLGMGNFWLYCDISGWHWYYSLYSSSFTQCLSSRNTKSYVPAVKAQVAKLPWSQEALPKIKYLKVSTEIQAAFRKVKEYESADTRKAKENLQMGHLLDVANHEQGVILQPLIYDDEDFSFWVKAQRFPGVSSISPDLELVFSHACNTEESDHKSLAPSETKLESFSSRMAWIKSAAGQFDKLMRKKQPYMEAQLLTMAGWVNLPDQ
ncbi:MAG: hypothetical protein A3G29_01035 [Burkholderiales bacterium RIFCSPLOWO2_12_FULL_64_99]|nr:MAG: hypothetical protein A3E52_03390 [Burkholderiales bacterium RIFCSPHIGHO2_12_FULL_63_20]OGB60507.1 MAG: hypothetical protein A3G29_01035 [Burkholderiales bacterium RIFCSPLOWO2_12_FULL_64_99]